MSIKIIDGMGTGPHITSNDIVSKQQAWLGTDSCVFDIGQHFAAEIVDNNTVSIADGEGCIKGCSWHILPGTSETVAIATGSQAAYRRDLIVARYTKDSEGVESVELDVLTGTTATTESAAVAPDVTENDIRDGVSICEYGLYEVLLNGLTIESVTAVFTDQPSLQEMYAMNPYNVEIVDSLPSSSNATVNTLYFVKAKS